MASDHRGNEVHAGKRTAQELGWRVSETSATNEATGEFSAWKRPQYKEDRSEMKARDVPGKSGKYRWSVTRPLRSGIPTDLDGIGIDMGKGKKATSSWGNPRYDEEPTSSVSGTVSTPARAMIAAEAMDKRIKEGRDLKTGRSKK